VNLKNFKVYLKNLGYSEKDLSECDKNTFIYKTNFASNVYYVYTPTLQDIFEKQIYFWNKNDANVFIAIGDNHTYIIHSKQKPILYDTIANNIIVKSFSYGVNTQGFESEKVLEITKEFIDSAYFFEFIAKQITNKKKLEVDKDLLLNLIALRNDLLIIRDDEEIIHLLILRSLFIKYLEDKGIYKKGYWVKVLESNKVQKVIETFNEIKKINGDIFDKELHENNIDADYLPLLLKFFTSDYITGQQSLFPYLFDQIPIQLISHIYEAFLQSEEKKGKGIYYTPSFVVNFMLLHSLKLKLNFNKAITVLDPAVGSGAFLVECFRAIIQAQPQLLKLSQIERFQRKKDILQNQLFGIDIDRKALQIAAFSLYLALIETENPEFIREQIKNAYPILPSLIDKNLIYANAITDEVFTSKTFGCIVSNPPWGSVNPNGDEENLKERKAIGGKGIKGIMPEYKNVSNFERSQAFLIRVKKWSNNNTIFSLIVKNSIFLNDKSVNFRNELIKTYQINYFYELSNYNKILFKRQKIGEIKGKSLEIGATEPCAILIFELPKVENNILKFISPKLNRFSESFQIIHYTQKDINEVEQNKFENDLLWQILVNGDLEDYKFIVEKIIIEKDLMISCKNGLQPSKNMISLGKPDIRKWIKPNEYKRYQIIVDKHEDFDYNRKMTSRRDPQIFENERIIIPILPLVEHNKRLKCIRLLSNEIFSDNTSSIILSHKNKPIKNYAPYLGIINSKLIGYYMYLTSSQWDKGEEKREKLKHSEIENMPLKYINESNDTYKQLKTLVEKLEKEKSDELINKYENEIDDLVFKLYDLTSYQKEIITEFYQARVEYSKHEIINNQNIEKYIGKFSEIFNNIMIRGKTLKATYNISHNLGAIICFTIMDGNKSVKAEQNKQYEILNFVKKKQIQHAEISKILNEDKVKIYDNKLLYIIKSNQFKDWTIRQAIKDAKEEIGLLLSKLPDRHD
jgi:hypothetical protein